MGAGSRDCCLLAVPGSSRLPGYIGEVVLGLPGFLWRRAIAVFTGLRCSLVLRSFQEPSVRSSSVILGLPGFLDVASRVACGGFIGVGFEPPAPVAAPSPVTQGTTPVLGLEEVLADIRKSLASLAPAAQAGAPPASLTGVALPAAVPAALPVPPPASKVPEHLAPVQDTSRQTLLEVSRLLASIGTPPVDSPPPTMPWVADDFLQNTLNELKWQVDALSAAHTTNLQASVLSQSVTLTPGAVVASPPIVQNVQPGPSKVPVQDNSTKEGTSDAVLSRPGKLTAHVAAEVKEKIWKGEFVDIFLLIRAKRREAESKDKEPKSSFFGERKPRVEESITNWLLGFNVFMSVWLEKKPELASSLIYYANKILKAQHTYGGYAWLEYDRDFRWARVEDPSIGWDQTEVEVWLECVNNKVSGRHPFRTQAHSERKGS
ncbi:hypothetical protein NDU88_005712 [Pleurodeles waltl]|uniref:Uncharacterized protein n=1 Tax=Pleurodeles waltl TaxID=8319 RepID=A0AAV7SMG4_PLEWA|nr:hypothetical protein NDU88_005712 [Pleurodeles waltl]